MKTAVGGGRPKENPLIQALLSGIMHTHKVQASGIKYIHACRIILKNCAYAITNLITDPQILSPQSVL